MKILNQCLVLGIDGLGLSNWGAFHKSCRRWWLRKGLKLEWRRAIGQV